MKTRVEWVKRPLKARAAKSGLCEHNKNHLPDVVIL